MASPLKEMGTPNSLRPFFRIYFFPEDPMALSKFPDDKLNAAKPLLRQNMSQTKVDFVMDCILLRKPKTTQEFIAAASDAVKRALGQSTSFARIGSFFGCSGSYVSKSVSKIKNKKNKKPTGPIFTPEQENKMIAEIAQRQKSLQPFSRSELLGWIQLHFGRKPTAGWFQQFKIRHENTLKAAVAQPLVKARSSLVPKQIRDYKAILKKHLTGVPAPLVFNSDECGYVPSVACKAKRVLVLKGTKSSTLFYKVRNRGCTTTILPCVPLQGKPMTPMFIFRGKKQPRDIYSQTVRDMKEVHVKTSTKGYITKDLFRHWLDAIFLPKLKKRREKYSLQKKPAVLIADNHAAHVDAICQQSLAKANCLLLTLPPHSSHLLQPLDLAPFGELKKLLREVDTKFGKMEKKQVVTDLLPNLERATDSKVVGAAFRRAGIGIESRKAGDVAAVLEDRLTEIEQLVESDAGTEPETDGMKATRSRPSSFGFRNSQYFPSTPQ
jgi:hypothetical protein